MIEYVLTWVMAHKVLLISYAIAIVFSLQQSLLEGMEFRRDLHKKRLRKAMRHVSRITNQCLWVFLFLQVLGWEVSAAVFALPFLIAINWVYYWGMFLIFRDWHMMRSSLGFGLAVFAEYWFRWLQAPEVIKPFILVVLPPFAVVCLTLPLIVMVVSLFWKVNPERTPEHLELVIAQALADGKIHPRERVSQVRRFWEWVQGWNRRIWLFVYDVGGSYFFGGGRLLEVITFKIIPWRLR